MRLFLILLISLNLLNADNSWLVDKLYGNDNEVASLRSVKIYKKSNQLRVKIDNQFNFDCELKLDKYGKPKFLLNCISQDKPSPICNPKMPNSFCAKSNNCFRTLPENKKKCYSSWLVKEKRIKLSCITTKKEDICRGKYTLSTTDNFDMENTILTIAKRRR